MPKIAVIKPPDDKSIVIGIVDDSTPPEGILRRHYQGIYRPPGARAEFLPIQPELVSKAEKFIDGHPGCQLIKLKRHLKKV